MILNILKSIGIAAFIIIMIALVVTGLILLITWWSTANSTVSIIVICGILVLMLSVIIYRGIYGE